MKRILLLILIFLQLSVVAQDDISIVPMPAAIEAGAGSVTIDSNTSIFLMGDGMINTAAYFNEYLQQFQGFRLKITQNNTGSNTIILKNNNSNINKPEGYDLKVNKNGIYITGETDAAVFYGIQTLMQLLPTEKKAVVKIPVVSISDSPRFTYRGMHLDVARHFMPVDFIKKYIDYLALHKLNTFHWHLTDDQGWRIEIKKYPKLTETGARRNGSIIGRYPGKGNDNIPHSGFYTQEQVKEIVSYAAKKYITIIPEIELPGHASAAIAAYPVLSCFPEEETVIPAGMVSEETLKQQAAGKKKVVQETWGVFTDVFCPTEFTFKFLQDVFDEVTALFPAKYIHIGGDECPKDAWKRSVFCQQLIREMGLKDEHELQSYFIKRIAKYLDSKGKIIVGWDEIAEGGLAPNAVVMSWRGETGGVLAAKLNHDVIMTPGNPVYFDHTQSMNEDSVTFGGYNPIEKVYAFEPVPAALTAKESEHILGAQANLWTEYITNPYKAAYMLFPRMAALSEVLWSPKEKRNLSDFEKRLPVQLKRYESWNVNYSKAYYDLKTAVLPAENNDAVMWRLETKFKDAKIVYKGTGVIGVMEYSSPVRISQPGIYTASLYTAHQVAGKVSQKFYFNKATGKKLVLTEQPSKSYPGDGAFTLVNGIQNEMGLARSREFIGFSGTDLDVTIDLGKEQAVTAIILHSLHLPASWIYLPREIEISCMPYIDTTVITRHAPIETTTYKVADEKNIQKIMLPEQKNCRYIRIFAKNTGIIPRGNPGSGEKAWLFVSEIEVN